MPDLVHMAVDIVDDSMHDLNERGLDPIQIFKQGIDTADQISTLIQTDSWQELMQSGLLDEEAIQVVGAMGCALKETRRAPARSLKPMQALRAMKDPEVQKSLGFLVGFAQAFGKHLSKSKNK